MRLGQAISTLLAEYGVEQVFGIPGVHTLELFRGIDGSGLRVAVPRHEQGAGFMADAYARVTGEPGVCYLITGPGVTNAMTPIAQAWHDSVPMLVIASAVERAQLGSHRGTLHDTPDLAEVLRPFTLISETVDSAARVAELIDEAFRRWAAERPRPVYIGVPVDLLAEEVGELGRPERARRDAAGSDGTAASPDVVATLSAVAVAAAPAGLADALDLLAAAERPVVVAGGGARHDRPAVMALAERVDAPVILTGNAKGLLPPQHPLTTGVSLFFPAAHRLLAEADLVLALGTELSDSEGLPLPPAGPELPEILRVDIDPTAAHPRQRRPAIPMRVAEFAARALEHLPPLPRVGGGSGSDRAAAVRDELAAARAADPYTPWIAALERALPDHALLTADSAQLAYQSHLFLELDSPGRWLAPYGFGTLGPALPMAIGAAIGAPGRPVVALAGDGSALFTLPELATAHDLGLPVVLVIWDNGGYREIERSFERSGIAPAGVRTTARDLGRIASGFGIPIARPTSPDELEHELRTAIERGGPAALIVSAPAELRVR
ncbi:5-guanidino-2-oxopentanoate decarboxylase [Leucobacter sp.]